MARPVDLMLFDLDGTLVDSRRDLARSVNHTLEALGLPGLAMPAIIGFVGDGIQALLERSLGPAQAHRIDEALRIFRAHYAEHLVDTTSLYPGVPETLAHFHAKRKLIVTNKNEGFSRTIVEKLGIGRFFADIVGSDTTPYLKPDRRLIAWIQERHPFAPARTVVIGDGVNDILFARNGGTLSCAHLNGLTRREDLLALHPSTVYEDPLALQDLFA